MRYVERNAYRADLVDKAEQWRWGSLWPRTCGDAAARRLLSDWPLPIPEHWPAIVDEPETEAEVQAIRHAIRRGCPYGNEVWR
jgi:putative transposase